MNNSITFLLVDDDNDDTDLFQDVLKDIDPSLHFISAVNGQEALELLRNGNGSLPNLIFLDLNMPIMGGKQCLQELKNDDKLKGIPVIIYTTSSHSKDIEQTIQGGAVCFITKPVSVRELKNILASVADNIHGDLGKTLRELSGTVDTFIVC